MVLDHQLRGTVQYFMNGGNDSAIDLGTWALAGQHADSSAANETFQQLPAPQPMAFNDLMIRLGVHTSTGGTDTVYTFRVNGIDTVLAVSIPQGTIGIFRDITNQIAVDLDDLLSCNMVFGSLTTAATVRGRCVRATF